MTRRIGWMMALAALVVVPLRAPAAEPTPTVVLRIRALETILEDVKYLAEMLGQKDTFALFEGQIAQVPGIDFKKPLGAYAYVSPGIVDSGFAVMVPVKSEKEILDLLGAFGMNPDKDADGVYTLNLPPPVPFPAHFRFASDYMYVTVRDKSALSKDTMIPPAKVFDAKQAELVDLSIRLDKIPDAVRQLVTTQLELNLPQLLELQKVPGETEAQAKVRAAAMKEFAGMVTTFVKDTREVKLQLDLDRKKHGIALQFSLDAAPNSEMAKSIAGMGKGLSPVAGLFSPDAAMSLSYNMQASEGLLKMAFTNMREQAFSKLEKEGPAQKALANKMLKALELVMKGGYESAGALRGPSANGQYVLIAGFKLYDAAELEKTIRDLVKDLPADVRSLIQLDHAKTGSVSIHRMQFPPPPNGPDLKRIFGEAAVYVALTPQAGFIALGQGGTEEIKKALALKPMASPPMRLELSLGRILSMLAEGAQGEKAIAAAKKVFQGADKDADRIRVTLDGGASLKFRIEAQTQLLKFLAAAGGAVP